MKFFRFRISIETIKFATESDNDDVDNCSRLTSSAFIPLPGRGTGKRGKTFSLQSLYKGNICVSQKGGEGERETRKANNSRFPVNNNMLYRLVKSNNGKKILLMIACQPWEIWLWFFWSQVENLFFIPIIALLSGRNSFFPLSTFHRCDGRLAPNF